MSQPQTVAEALFEATREISLGLDNNSPRLDAEVLLSHVTQWSRTELHARIKDPLKEKHWKQFATLMKQRIEGVPVAYLVGWKDFYGRRFSVGPGVLVPRPETEVLVEKSLDLLRHSPGATKILDIGCGSGCIGITLCLETLNSEIFCADISDAALKRTRENIAYFGIEQRATVTKSDLFSSFQKEAFDLVVSNPPYVGTEFGPRPDKHVAAHEPETALFSGPNGIEHLKKIVQKAPQHLIEGGSLILECASFQAEMVEAWMADLGFQQTALWHDLSGLPRGVSGRWEG